MTQKQMLNSTLTIEDAFESFVLANHMERLLHPTDEPDRMTYSVNMNAVDTSTEEKYAIIRAYDIGPIRELDILYSYQSDDVIFSVIFMNQENEVSEFTYHTTASGRLKKSGTYWLRFDTLEEFIHFFNRFIGKSLKQGTTYEYWRDPDEGYEKIV